MSLYIVSQTQINLRHPDVFLCHENCLELFKDNNNKNVITYTKYNFDELLHKLASYNNAEIVVPNIDEHQFILLIENIINFLEENDLSIGVIISDDLIKNNLIFLQEKNIYICKTNLKKEEFKVKHRIEYTIKKPPRKRNKSLDFQFKASRKSVPQEELLMAGCALEPENISLNESFKKKLLKYINKSKKSNVEIYTASGITRQVFSKIISYDDYEPKKETIICLIIGLELCLDDALDLLNAAGYTLSNSILFDVIIKGEISKSNYDINLINEILDSYNLQIIGWNPR